MKGTILKCMEEMIIEQFSEDRWKEILVQAGLKPWRVYSATENVEDGEFLLLVETATGALSISRDELYERFGFHWSTRYAPGLYRIYYDRASNARDFILYMNNVHEAITRRMKDARPPRFHLDASHPKQLVIRYESARGLAALMPALLRGVAHYYNERVQVERDGDTVTVFFA